LRSETFRRRARLSGQGTFRALLRSRRGARGERFHVQATANGQMVARLGVVVGKRVAPLAVDRNYLKRLVREIFRRQQRELVGFDLLVRPRRTLSREEAATASAELHSLLAAVVR
jgi:ribonuclease P protein component